jgi:HAD superfamily hydrolase (TIGR01484 family)
MKRKVIAFDLDDTLAVTKSPISDEMADLLRQLLEIYDVCVVSGGRFEQFKIQIVDRLDIDTKLLKRLHLMPTCGTRYYRFNEKTGEWNLRYAEDLSDGQKKQIVDVLEDAAKKLGYWEKHPAGEIVEDRLSQITFSALGQKALPEDKYKWDPDHRKKQAMRDYAAERLPGLEVRIGGTTSVDVTRPGIDKAYGMRKLMAELDIKEEDILFFGDKLEEGGNDYPVKAMGIGCIEVKHQDDTALALEAIIQTA